MSEVKVDKRTKEYRERSASDISVDQAHREGITMGDDRDPNTKVQQERVRVPVNAGENLSLRGYSLDWDNYHYRWVYEDANKQGRVAAYEAAFYELCQHQGVNLQTSSGGGVSYLMRLPKKYWDEDMLAARKKNEAIRRRDNQLAKGEYTVDAQGRAVDEGEVIVRRSVSDNPYS